MKTKNLIRTMFLVVGLSGLIISGCTKEKKNQGQDTTSMQQLAKDENQVSAGVDDATNDVNAVLSGGTTKSTESLPCNATLDSTIVVNDHITYHITYNGLNCIGTINRHGVVEVTRKLNTPWSAAGAYVSVKFINLEITHVLSQKHLTINGTKTLTNVSGGLLSNLGAGMSSIVHRMSGELQITFDDGSTRTWHIARQRTFTGTMGHLGITLGGFGSSGSYNDLEAWGVNRNGEDFYTKISQHILFKQVCNWHPVSGILIHQIPADNKSATITYGFDSNNQPVVNDNCPTKYKLDWVKNGNSGTIFLDLP